MPIHTAMFLALVLNAQNWTRLPEDWKRARARWEYSHASSAVLSLVGLVATISAVLAAR